MNKIKNVKQGFTLLELLVVVLIIGILAAIALPKYQLAVDRAKYSTMMDLVKAVKNEQEIFYLTNNKYAADFEELGTDILPDGFELSENKRQANYGDYFVSTITHSGQYVYGYRVKPTTSFILPLDLNEEKSLRRSCWAYGEIDKRGRGSRLCKSFSNSTNPYRNETGYESWSVK